MGTVGGYVCALAIHRYGTMGCVALWLLGAVTGFVARKIVGEPSQLVGWMLVIAGVCALVIAEVYWIHWNIEQGTESWWTAATLLVKFVQQYELAAIIGAVMTGFGCWSAYRQTAFGIVAVATDGKP